MNSYFHYSNMSLLEKWYEDTLLWSDHSHDIFSRIWALVTRIQNIFVKNTPIKPEHNSIINPNDPLTDKQIRRIQEWKTRIVRTSLREGESSILVWIDKIDPATNKKIPIEPKKLIYCRLSSAIDKYGTWLPLLKFEDLDTGETFAWDGFCSAEKEILLQKWIPMVHLRKRTGKIYYVINSSYIYHLLPMEETWAYINY